MTVIWLIVWLCKGTPDLQVLTDGNVDMNNWMIALAICLFLDFGAGVLR